MVLERQGGGTAVLERPPVSNAIEDSKELGEKDLEKARSSLTVIENPSLDGYLTILMAKRIIPYNGDKTFLEVYLITANKDYKVASQPLRQSRAKATTLQVGNQLLYIISDENNVTYPTASLVPHEPCRIGTEEFQRFKDTMMNGGSLEGMVSSMAQLIGQRLTVKGFAFNDGKLVVPPNYASRPLRYLVL